MANRKSGRWRTVAVSWTLAAALLASSCQTGGLSTCLPCLDCAGGAKVCQKPTIRALAHDLDELESHVERYGSVVPKQPDVWGQARLTRHREQFEKEMETEFGKFSDSLQGSLSRSDQAYVADSFALSAAISGRQAGAASPNVVVNAATAAGTKTETPTVLKPLDLPTVAEQQDTFAGFTKITRNDVPKPPDVKFVTTAGTAIAGISLEPTVHLDQKARYLNHLNELRRTNEGDDTADSPGYSLNLVRIPVSVLPGKKTGVGCGAEVTMTLTPYLGDELLPTTFRNLVLNDLTDQIGFPLTQFLNDPRNHVYLAERNVADVDDLILFVESYTTYEQVRSHLGELQQMRAKPNLQAVFARPEWAWVDELLLEALAPQAAEADPQKMGLESAQRQQQHQQQRQRQLTAKISRSARATFQHAAIAIPATKSRRARLPFPPSQMADIYGFDNLFHLAADAFRAFSKERISRPCLNSDQIFIHLPDIQGYLQEELAAANKFLASPANADLWGFCTPDLAAAIRTHQLHLVQEARARFRGAVLEKAGGEDRAIHATAAALAWAVIVESALLNDQLVQDMRESASAKNCACAPAAWLPYFLPAPPAEARQAFNDYVRCRWPIHVFALDPVTQQQNIADTFSGRRELQLAMSLAFVSGNISARNMMRYARRIEYDLATIDLNGTAVGFSHGDDTFGWRFYPRYQTPDIEGNLTVIGRDLLIGGPNRDTLLRQRRLEPGMRECLAVVIMPSFVPYATLHTNSNWFKLTNPKCKELDSTDAVKLGKAVKSIQNCAGNVGDAACYRDGDLERLLYRAKQLEARLPLQSTMVQVPYENTLGGFAMFNTGVTDLAPELNGWYGASSVNPDAATTVFLVGNHFSVHQTQVIAGGKAITDSKMLSRQVMQAVIPAGAGTVGNACGQFVDVHIATPYGVTTHMLIPVCPKPAAADAAKGLAWAAGTVQVAFVYGGVGIVPSVDPKTRPPALVLKAGSDGPKPGLGNKVVTLALKVTTPDGDRVVNVAGNYDKAKDVYTFDGGVFATALLGQVALVFGPESTNPPCPLTGKGELTFTPDPKAADVTLATQPLTITWLSAPQ